MKAKENFTYNETKPEYIITLKRKRLWWLLLFLLLLLPLLLLIKLKKDVVFKTIDEVNESILADADVVFTYKDRNLIDFETFSFFTKNEIIKEGKTDENGQVIFTEISYSLYSLLFFKMEKSKIMYGHNRRDFHSPRNI